MNNISYLNIRKSVQVGAKMFALISFTSLLSGCIALALAPLAPLAGGLASSSTVAEIDPASVTPELKSVLTKARRLAVITNDPSISYFAAALDRKGGFEVSAIEATKTPTPSQTRALMKEVCDKKKTDVVLAATSGKTDTQGSTAAALLIGRSIIDISSNVEVLRCADKWQGNFTTKVKLNQGAYNMDQVKISQTVGEEFAKAYLKMLDR
jgi:hypothetical protein